ncbi:hypothetical protein P5618_029645 (plasmid) [Priestia megaterium]|uniref:hypothetical protein n=1 Tax=Priestia megaterium TaxID=1404 RepID=UPI002452A525|nr:hypothetical protein [Priestia megaterium]MDH3177923.1 hypothetical protein [Priestia megaterium]
MADWTTAITIIGSLSAASTAQIVSHILTNRREKKKYERECLQNLYSPVIFTIIDYLEAENDKAISISVMEAMEDESEMIDEKKYEEYSLKPDSIFEKILESVTKNLKYAHPSLIMAYEEVKSLTDTFKDNTEEYSFIFYARIEMCRELLVEFIRISTELKAISRNVQERLYGSLFFTEFYLLLIQCNYWSLAEVSIKHFGLINTILLPKNNFLSRISNIRKEISRVTDTPAYKDRNRYEEAITDAYHFLHEIIDEFSILSEDDADYWRDELEIEWKKRDEITGLS